MNRMVTCLAIAAALLLFAPSAWAEQVAIETVTIGNPGNVAEGKLGKVDYSFQMGKYEVTVAQYTAFLNAVAQTDTYGLYTPLMASDLNIAGISRSGTPGSYSYSVIGSPNKPVTYVNWGDAARFTNWLHNGQPVGLQDAATTEDGAYSLNGATSREALWQVTRNANATWFLPSEDEWYKAAFHKNDGATGNYWQYTTMSDTAPVSVPPPGTASATPSQTANFYSSAGYAVTGSTTLDPNQNYLTDVGAYQSAIGPYGTFDQGGNVWEWNEKQTSGFDGGEVLLRGAAGGSWFQGSIYLSAEFGGMNAGRPEVENFLQGFRVASVPEPSTCLLAALGAMAAALLPRRLGRCR